MITSQKSARAGQKDDFIKIQDLFYLCSAKWKWFILSLVVTLGCAAVYILRTPPVYNRTASVLIKEDSNGNSISSDSEFAGLGLFQSSTNVNNELIAFKSPAVMTEVVKRLHLDMNYYLPGRFHDLVAYGKNLPVTAEIAGLAYDEPAGFSMNVNDDGSVTLSDFSRDREKFDDKEVSCPVPGSVETPIGQISVEPTPYYKKGETCSLRVTRSGMHAAVGRYSVALTAALNDEKASVIDLSLSDSSIERAEDVLNTVINVYNENWVKDKNQIAVSTSMFINERLGVIERELGNVDEDISSYKSEHLLPDVQAASSMYMQQSSETSERLLQLNNQLYMARYIRKYLADGSNRTHLLPANSGIDGGNIEQQIGEYNKLLLQRNSLVENSSAQNPLVTDMDNSLSSMRTAIVRSVDNLIATLGEQIKSLQATEEQTTRRIAASPTQAKYLLSVERQQKVKESLYLFLLQKREENELSQAFTAYNTRVITPPQGSMIPIAPVRKNILLVAFALGLLIPVVVIFIRENMNTKIRGRKDLEGVSVPLIGEIPLCGRQKKRSLSDRLRRRKDSEYVANVAVREGSRNVANEAFRVLRTNLEFMTEKGSGANVIAVTSFNPGSGKSFMTVNMALSMAVKGEKVLVVDGDLRHGSASTYVDSPKEGLGAYLGGHIDDWKKTAVNYRTDLDILPVGKIPPNPTELLLSDRFGRMIEEARRLYDHVLIDCPPVELVADTQIIDKAADRTLFIIRAGLFERSMLSELENIYDEKKYRNMAIVLNGTQSSSGRYGYGYGYASDYYNQE